MFDLVVIDHWVDNGLVRGTIGGGELRNSMLALCVSLLSSSLVSIRIYFAVDSEFGS